MFYMYDSSGRYIGYVDLEEFVDPAYSHTQQEPPDPVMHETQYWKPITWPYYTGTTWELRDE